MEARFSGAVTDNNDPRTEAAAGMSIGGKDKKSLTDVANAEATDKFSGSCRASPNRARFARRG